MEFSFIRNICPDQKDTWEKKIFLTFDLDWATDAIIVDTLELLNKAGVKATFFATHSSPAVSEIVSEGHEVGIHPNFNELLKGKGNGKTSEQIVLDLMGLFPEAKSVRSHSLCFGSLIQTHYEACGITHDSSVIIPHQQNAFPLAPFQFWDNLIRVPHFFCDYVSCMEPHSGMQNLIQRPGLKVFSFHPIHVYLNTEDIDRYERTRPIHQNPSELIKRCYKGYGTRARLLELLACS